MERAERVSKECVKMRKKQGGGTDADRLDKRVVNYSVRLKQMSCKITRSTSQLLASSTGRFGRYSE